MSVEKEFKFECHPDQYQSLKPFLEKSCPNGAKVKNQRNLYFDTTDFSLKKQGIELRLRDVDGSFFEQTIKIDNTHSGLGGQFDRCEYNITLIKEQLDLSLFTMHDNYDAFKGVIENIQKSNVKPLFVTQYNRTAYKIDWQGSKIECAYDVGEVFITNEKRQSEPLSEMEVELIKGNPEVLFTFKDALRDALQSDMTPLTQSKGARGYALLQ